MELTAPIIPDAQHNKSSEILLEGLRGGFAAAAQIAQQRRQSESDLAHLALQERLQNEAHDLERTKLSMASEMIPYQKSEATAKASLQTEQARAYSEGRATSAQQTIKFNRQKETLFSEVNKTAQDLQLDDPVFQTKEPMQFAANVMAFKDMYGLAPMPEVKGAIKHYQDIADQQKIVIRPNAIKDELGQWKTGEPRSVPIWVIAKNLQDPNAHEQTMMDLEASGHITKSEENVPGTPGKIFGSWWPDAPTKKTIEKHTPAMDRLLQDKTQFQHAPSKVPSVMLPSSSATGTAPTELPVDVPVDATTAPGTDSYAPQSSNTSPDYGPDVDVLLGHARAALQRGAAPKDVAMRLNSFGVDPNQLWAT